MALAEADIRTPRLHKQPHRSPVQRALGQLNLRDLATPIPFCATAKDNAVRTSLACIPQATRRGNQPPASIKLGLAPELALGHDISKQITGTDNHRRKQTAVDTSQVTRCSGATDPWGWCLP